MSNLKLGTQFSVELTTEEALERARRYLTAAGYDLKSDSTVELRGRRGSRASTLLALSPRGWSADVMISALPREGKVDVKSVFAVSLEGQVPSRHEGEYWREEVQGLEQAVRDGADRSAVLERLARRLIVLNVVALPALFVAWLVPVYFAVLAAATEETWSVRDVGLLGGAVVLGCALAVLVGRVGFGLFVRPKDLPYAQG